MKIKIFSILIGSFLGLIVYSFIGYIFTKKIPIGKKYKFKLFLFLLLFILILLIYYKFGR